MTEPKPLKELLEEYLKHLKNRGIVPPRAETQKTLFGENKSQNDYSEQSQLW